VAAPAGVVAHHPAEMIVRVRAGTTLAELQEAVGRGGQHVAMEADDPARATVGGVLAVGRSGRRRLGWGPVRDTVLEVTAVSSRGQLIRAGAPLVKNVTGFDLCRLLVGSLGTLAVLAEVVLRCRPRAEVESWWVGDEADPFGIAARLYRPLAVLWDGSRTWVGLEGCAADVSAQVASVLGPAFVEVDGPPARPGPRRRSLPPAQLRRLPPGRWLAEVGVGVVHCDPDTARALGPPAPPDVAVVELHGAIKARFDPFGRMNPGRSVLVAAS
jgi:glycolate oxidase FAD binding subunit